MHIALPTWKDKLATEVDDQILVQALTEKGVTVSEPCWHDDHDWSKFDGCVIRTVWDYQERFEEFLAWVEQVASQTAIHNPLNVIRWNSHKSYLKEMALAGLAIAPSVWLDKGGEYELEAIMREQGWDKGFIKPLIGANARETIRFTLNGEELRKAQSLVNRLTPDEDLVLQPYLKSVESFGETSGIFFDGQFSHGRQKIPVPGDYRVQDDYGAKDYDYVLSEAELDLAARSLKFIDEKFGIELLYARIDFLFGDAGEAYLNELEIIEPSLFFRNNREAADRFADAIIKRFR